MMKPTTIFLLILLTLTSSLAWATKPDPVRQKLKARDAITLSIQEIREITKFVKLIPRLKIMQISRQTPQLKLCVDRLVFDLEAMKTTLHRLKHLKHNNILPDSKFLEREMAHTVNLSKTCTKSFRNVDEVVLSMLTRKLGNLALIIDDVVHLVSEMEPAETKMNPSQIVDHLS